FGFGHRESQMKSLVGRFEAANFTIANWSKLVKDGKEDRETGRHGDRETRRPEETGTRGAIVIWLPRAAQSRRLNVNRSHLPISRSPCLLVSLSPRLLVTFLTFFPL